MTLPAKESAVVSACIKWLWAHGCFVWRNNSGAYKPEGSNRFIRFGRIGSSDIVGVTKGGRFISVECKSGKNKLTPQQEVFRDQIIDHNGLHIVARSADDLEAYKQAILAAHWETP